MIDDTKPFPIQGLRRLPNCTIPWWLAAMAYEVYASKFGRQQSLERLAQRGGFGRHELVWLLRGALASEMGDGLTLYSLTQAVPSGDVVSTRVTPAEPLSEEEQQALSVLVHHGWSLQVTGKQPSEANPQT